MINHLSRQQRSLWSFLRMLAPSCREAGMLATGSSSLDSLQCAVRLAAAHSHIPQALPGQWWRQQARFTAVAEQQAAADEQIQLTENAVQKMHELLSGSGNSSSLLRLTVEAGGCSGFSYKFNLDTELQDGDRVFEAGGVRLVTDGVSYEFVRGAKVDYSQDLIKSAFEVIDNPNADKGCGCGTSFSPK